MRESKDYGLDPYYSRKDRPEKRANRFITRKRSIRYMAVATTMAWLFALAASLAVCWGVHRAKQPAVVKRPVANEWALFGFK